MEEWTDDFEKILDAIRVNIIILSNIMLQQQLTIQWVYKQLFTGIINFKKII